MATSHEILSSLSSAKSLASVPSGVVTTLVQAVGGAIYFWLDGTTPTNAGASGHYLADGDSIYLQGSPEANGFKCIQKTGDTSVVMASYRTAG